FTCRAAASGTQRRALSEGNRLSGPRAPVLVGELGAIPGHDGNHGIGPLHGLRRNFYLLACCRGEANRQRKSVQEGARDHPASRCDCTWADQILPGHSLSPVGGEHCDGVYLADQTGDCPRAIAVTVERLLLTRALPPIARGFASQFPER